MKVGISDSIISLIKNSNPHSQLLSCAKEVQYLVNDCLKATYGSSVNGDDVLDTYKGGTMVLNVYGGALSEDGKQVNISTDGNKITLMPMESDDYVFKIELVAGKLVSDVVVEKEKTIITREFDLGKRDASLTKKVNGEFVINSAIKPKDTKFSGVEHFGFFVNGKQTKNITLLADDVNIVSIMTTLDTCSDYKPEPLLQDNITLS